MSRPLHRPGWLHTVVDVASRALLGVLGATVCVLPVSAAERAEYLIGYNEHRTNLPGGRHANVSTNRAMTVRGDGSERRAVAAHLVNEPHTWTQFVGWSPDGRSAIVGRAWADPENAAWEEAHQTFRFGPGRWLYDSHIVDLATGAAENVTAVERVSEYNTGLFFWPKDPQALGFTALINGVSKPFRMRRDGTGKTDLTAGSNGFAYGFSSSPDGRRIAYHENYQVYLANADGSDRQHVQTGHPFVFAPTWSPDGQWLLFVSGEHYNCHPHVVRADGTGLRQLASRQGYRGVTLFLDVPDYHQGSSDIPCWSADGQHVFYTAQHAEQIELFCVSLAGEREQLTNTPPGTEHYHPRPSPDGEWLLFGSKREGVRNLYLLRLADRREFPLTQLPLGFAAMHAHWQPRSTHP